MSPLSELPESTFMPWPEIFKRKDLPSALAAAMGYPFEKDYVKINLEILSNLSADATTSMQRDIMEGKPSELDGLVMEPLRLAKKYSVSMPCYEEVAKVLCPLEF